ncbi:MAG: hypothetical protein VX574_02440 [Myxococcota bacterium]|nr:hypothetical protein [Myxococcota bacterium]
MKGTIRDRWRLPATLLGAAFAGWLWFGSEKIPARPTPVSAAPVAAEPEQVSVPTEIAPRLRRSQIAEEPGETLEEMRQPTRLYGTARIEAVYDRHDFLGVEVRNVDEGSLWDLLGFRSGDLVVEANGELVDNPAAGVQFMNSLARDSSVVVRVRGTDGEERWIDFRFPAS